MNKGIWIVGIVLLFASCSANLSTDEHVGWESYSGDPVIENKVDSLLALMTLEEKIGQLNQYTANYITPTGEIKDNVSGDYFRKGLVGSTFNVFDLDVLRKIQQQTLNNSRLKIPMLFAADVVHGYNIDFPIPLGEACSWDLKLTEQTARVAAEEATSAGIMWTFAPMIDISRDPRWGRVVEGAGEDPYLGSLVATARVKGFQGIDTYKDISATNTMMACAKHFVAYGGAQAGRDYNTVDISERTLREIYLPPFHAAAKQGVASIMTAFNDLNGVPCTANKQIATNILRKDWSFNGVLVSDYTAIEELINHGIAKDKEQAASLALNAGTDLDMVSESYISSLSSLVESGKVSEEQIDVAVSRILEMKFLLGLFDDPYKYFDKKRESKELSNPKNLEIAKQSAQRSIVLLKNEHQLPILKTERRNVALIGPYFKEKWGTIRGGDYEAPTLYSAIVNKYDGSSINFSYTEGTSLPVIDYKTAKVSQNNAPDRRGFNEAIRLAKKSDVILVAMGEDKNWTGEAASRSDITLPGNQRELLKELKKTGKPIVLVLFNGRPLDLSWEEENVDAIVEAWFPGTMAGHAVADVISGDYNPSGKLVMTFPRNVGQIPIFYNGKSTGRPFNAEHPADYRSSYLDVENTPLYPFGYGLSYTNFSYNNATISSDKMQRGGSVKVSVDVTNNGSYDGEEVVQLYIQDPFASVSRAVKELKGFQKIQLNKGETKTVEFTIDEEMLSFYDIDMNWLAEAGDFNVWLASSSADETNELSFALVD